LTMIMCTRIYLLDSGLKKRCASHKPHNTQHCQNP
jgi:hypothetical protein